MATKNLTNIFFILFLFVIIFFPQAQASNKQTSTNREYVPGEVVVVYKDNALLSKRSSVTQSVKGIMEDSNADGIDDRFSYLLNGRIAKINIDKSLSVEKAIEILKNDPNVQSVEPNYILNLANTSPDDSLFEQLWGLHNTGLNSGVADADIDAIEAWDITRGSRDIVVGVIDSGVDYTHPDLIANLWVNPNEIPGNNIDDDNNGYIDDIYGINTNGGTSDPDDDNGHGTHVSGTIGATGNNQEGVTGVNWESTMASCKAFDAAGRGNEAFAIECVNYMVGLKRQGVNLRVINASWGYSYYIEALEQAIEEANQEGILFVAAAGNDSVDNDLIVDSPASFDGENIISVASTTRTDAISSFSSYGANSVDLGAPGSDVVSTLPDGLYGSLSGTSMAAPHVTGTAALIWSVAPELTVQEVKELLLDTGDLTQDLIGITLTGKRLNAFNALTSINDPRFALNVLSTPQNVTQGETATFEFQLEAVLDWDRNAVVSVDAPEFLVVDLPNTTVGADDLFSVVILALPDAQPGEHTITFNVTENDFVKSFTSNITVLPTGLIEVEYFNADSPIDIPDADPAGISSNITVPDTLEIFEIRASVQITHTWIGDLLIELVSPDGTVIALQEFEGGSNDNIDTVYSTTAFNGQFSAGEWTLQVADFVGADTGTLESWSLTVVGLGDVTPPPPIEPEAGFTFSTQNLTATFTDTSTDADGEVVTWLWDFGDNNTSIQQNPTHVYATSGTYDVTLRIIDNDGLTSSISQQVTVTQVANLYEAEIVRQYRSRFNTNLVAISHTVPSEALDVYRDDQLIEPGIPNVGTYVYRSTTDNPENYEFLICEAGTNRCTSFVTTSFILDSER
ncbi:MAG: S8 family serine peptidase [Pseudomonadota bacterium]